VIEARYVRGSRCIELLLRPIDIVANVSILERADHHEIDFASEDGAQYRANRLPRMPLTPQHDVEPVQDELELGFW